MLLSIETSCDETAVAVFSLDKLTQDFIPEPLYQAVYSQTKTHQPYGGVVPEIASREHSIKLPLMINDAFTSLGATPKDIKAVAVTFAPGLKGCLLVGLSFAKAFCLSRNIPLIPINHLEGHLYAGFVGKDLQNSFMSLIASGGHTEIVFVNGFRKYRVLCKTRDDAAGEAFDKVASILTLPYPGGPALSKLAEEGNPKAFSFPVGVPEDNSTFSFSGLKTAVLREVQKIGADITEEIRANLAASAEHAIVEALITKSKRCLKKNPAKHFVLTGGVAANRLLRQRFNDELDCDVIIPSHSLCTDNATMIGAVGLLEYFSKKETYQNWSSTQHSEFLGPNAPYQLGAEARLSLEKMSAS